MAKRNPHKSQAHTTGAKRAHELLVKRRKAGRAGVPKLNPATGRTDKAHR